MSGGCYDYAYVKLDEFIDDFVGTSPLRKAFKTHLRRVSKAIKDIEWVDSGDMSGGDEYKSIQDVLGPRYKAAELLEAIAEAKGASFQLEQLMQKAEQELMKP